MKAVPSLASLSLLLFIPTYSHAAGEDIQGSVFASGWFWLILGLIGVFIALVLPFIREVFIRKHLRRDGKGYYPASLPSG